MQMETNKQKSWGTNTFIKIDFKIKTVTRDKGHYITLKGAIQQEDITIVNLNALNIEALKYKKLIQK